MRHLATQQLALEISRSVDGWEQQDEEMSEFGEPSFSERVCGSLAPRGWALNFHVDSLNVDFLTFPDM